jgi:hypothetical protein
MVAAARVYRPAVRQAPTFEIGQRAPSAILARRCTSFSGIEAKSFSTERVEASTMRDHGGV